MSNFAPIIVSSGVDLPEEAAKVAPPIAGDAEPLTLRRWEAAQTTRLNEAQWQLADNPHNINQDLQSDLARLRARSTFEAYNNSLVESLPPISLALFTLEVANRTTGRLY